MAKNLFRNKIVVITDGETSLGSALAIEVAKQKADVIIITQKKENLNDTIDQISKLKKAGKAIPIVGDLTTKNGCDAAIALIKRAVGTIDILINNAAIINCGKFEDNKADQVTNMINKNVTGTILFTQLALPLLRNNKRPGIINIADSMGKVAFPYLSVYSATQFALTGFTQALQRELSGDKLRIMSVYTAGITDSMNEATEDKLKKLGFTYDNPEVVAGRIIETYNLEKNELVFGKKENSLAFWNTVLKSSVDNKFKKIRTKILNAISASS